MRSQCAAFFSAWRSKDSVRYLTYSVNGIERDFQAGFAEHRWHRQYYRVQRGWLRASDARDLRYHYVAPGMPIATAGYPMGHLPLTAMNKLNQFSPFLRRGIISSVFPFSIPQPHGFTIDILQQGGSSGSPILCVDKPQVVGMMASSMLDDEENTNISFCEAAGSIANALQSFMETMPVPLNDVKPLAEYLERIPLTTTAKWESWR